MPNRSKIMFACLTVIAAVTMTACSDGSSTDDRSRYVLAVTNKDSARLGPYAVGDDSTLAAALVSFGKPTTCHEDKNGFAVVRWDDVGITARFGSNGGDELDRPVCERWGSVQFHSATITGRRWQTPRGLQVGDRASRVARLYPLRLNGGPVLVDRFDEAANDHLPSLTVRVKDGKVVALVVDLQYEGS